MCLIQNIGSFWLFVHIKMKSSLFVCFFEDNVQFSARKLHALHAKRGFAKGGVTWRNWGWGCWLGTRGPLAHFHIIPLEKQEFCPPVFRAPSLMFWHPTTTLCHRAWEQTAPQWSPRPAIIRGHRGTENPPSCRCSFSRGFLTFLLTSPLCSP